MINTVQRGLDRALGDGVAIAVLQGTSANRWEPGARGAIALARKFAHYKGARQPPAAAAGPEDRLAAEAVDRAYLARFTLDNAALEREVLELFAAQAPVYLERLREATTRKAWREAAHNIKGSAAAIGAWRLARLAEMAETIDIEAALAGRAQAIAAVGTASEEVCRYIARLYPAY
jgi:HPt (histidine-containing phosphotransfer) domain-containing protein